MFWTKILPVFLIFTLFIPVHGKEPENSVVFLIDLSGSMKTSDEGQKILDAIAQCISMLPSNYQVSILGFNDKLVIDLPFATLSNGFNVRYLTEQVQNIPYSGYSNAGLGLHRAVERLEDGVIVFISDGEILLPTTNATEESKKLWQEGIELAQNRGVIISTIGFGDWNHSFLLESLRQTQGAFYPDSMALPEILQTMLQDDFHLPLEVYHQVKVEEQRIQWNLPVSDADSLYLLLQSEEKIEEISWDYPDSGSFIGDYYVAVHLDDPLEKEFPFHIKTEQNSEVYLSLWGELQVIPVVTYLYEDILSEDGNNYRCTTTAQLTFVNRNGESVFLDDFSPSQVMINGDVHPLVNGAVLYSLDFTEKTKLVISFSHPPMMITSDSVWITPESILLEKNNEFSFRWYLPFLPFLLCFLTFVVFGVKRSTVSKRKHKNKTQKALISNKTKSRQSKHTYVGTLKLKLTVSREDFPMKQFSLFRVAGHRPITLEEILATCYPTTPIVAAENITFSPWKEKSVALTHESSATLLYNQTILRKNQRYTIPVGATIEVSFDDVHQLVIIYDLS